MSWIENKWPAPGYRKQVRAVPQAPLVRYVTCKSCQARLHEAAFIEAHQVCSVCGHHHLMSAYERLDLLTSSAEYSLLGEHLQTNDYLSFCDTQPYAQRLVSAKKKTHLSEAVLSVTSSIDGIAVAMSIFDFRFIGGSLGAVAGERVVLAIQTAIDQNMPFICVTASGGARMQEGIQSLFQMAKMSAAVNRLKQTRLPFINVLTHPTFGGVSASIAMQADIIIAEKGAHIGFTGARVIANAMSQPLPEGFQTAEFLRDHGCVDAVVSRNELSGYLSRILRKALKNK